MISIKSIEKIAEEQTPFPYTGEKDIVVFLINRISSIKDAESLREAFRGVMKAARTLGMDFSGLKEGQHNLSRHTPAESVYPLLKILMATYSIRKKVIIATGYLAELAEEERVELC